MESIKDIKGIIFDYGGTIDSRGDHWSEIIWEGYERADVDIDKPAFRDAYVYAERELARVRHIEPQDNFFVLLCKKIAIELFYLAAKAELTEGQRRFFDELMPSQGRPLLSLADQIASHCYEHARACIEEARPTLEALAARCPMVLVSNFYGNVDTVLRDFDVRRYFQGVIESAVVGVRKPDPRIFRLGVVALGLEPHEVLVVGDSLRKDILPAESIGCRTAWLKGRGWTADEDAATHPSQIKNLAELSDAIL